MAPINSALVEVKKVTELPDLALALENYFAHCGVDGILYKINIQGLVDFIAPYVSAIGASPFVENTGSPLPNPIDKLTAITFVGIGTFDQTTGSDVVTTEELNVLFWSSNGATGTWILGVAIPIDLTNYVLETDFIALSDRVPVTVPSKNLFDVSKVRNDMYQPSSTAHYTTQIGWVLSPDIVVTPGSSYFISGTITRAGIGMYNASDVCVRYINQTGGLVVAQTGEVKMVFNLKSNVTGPYSNVQVEIGTAATSYVAFGGLVPLSGVVGLPELKTAVDANTAITTEVNKTFDFESIHGANILNPVTFSLGTLLNENTGVTTTGGASLQYDTSDYIPVTVAQLYTLLNIKGLKYMRKIVFYDAAKVYISGINGNDDSTKTFTPPASTVYARISVPGFNYTAIPGVFTPDGYGLFAGATPVWVPYEYISVKIKGEQQSTGTKPNDEVATIDDVKNLTGGLSSDSTDSVDYTLFGNLLTVGYGLNTIIGQVFNSRGYTGNNMFNFASYSQNGVSAAILDDVAPTHSQNTTIGANHGQPAYAATVSAHGLTNTAIGKSWTIGGITFYLMRIQSANVLIFLSANSGTPTAPAFTPLTTGTLVGTPNLTVTAVNSSQIYPSIKNLVQKVLKNGIDNITESTGTAKFIDVAESYDIFSVNDMLNNIIARANTAPDPVFTGDSVITISNVYRFLPNNAVVVLTSIHAVKSVAFDDLMAVQAVLIGIKGITQYYVPNSLPVGALDFRTPLAVNWSGAIATTFFTVASQADPTNPPNRIIQYYGNTGFMVAFMKTIGVGKAVQNYTNRTFEIRNDTGKIYPHPIEGTKIGNPIPLNYAQNVAMVRVYTNLSETRIGNRLSCFNFNFEDAEYVYLDYSGSMIDHVNLNRTALNGKTITVIEIKNAVLNTDAYQVGFYVTATYISGETCFAVLKIS